MTLPKSVKQTPGARVKLRVFLADDHIALREGLRLLINSQPDMECVGEAGSGREVLQQSSDCQAEIVVMDISMPEVNGAQATEVLKRKCPNIKVLVLTRYADAGHLRHLLEVGASGYILKRAASAELINAIRRVAHGDIYLDPSLAVYAAESLTHKPLRGALAQSTLTARELEVLRSLAFGYTNKEIAHQLAISVKTVEAHKASAMRKLELRSRADIVRYALLQGWLDDQS